MYAYGAYVYKGNDSYGAVLITGYDRNTYSMYYQLYNGTWYDTSFAPLSIVNKINTKIQSYERMIALQNDKTNITIKATDTRQYFEISVSVNGNTIFSKYVGVYSYSLGTHSFTKIAGTKELSITIDSENQSFSINNAGSFARLFIKSYHDFSETIS